jgi:hypothetical protein
MRLFSGFQSLPFKFFPNLSTRHSVRKTLHDFDDPFVDFAGLAGLA